MRAIYIDRQIFIDSCNRVGGIYDAIDTCKRAGYIFPYSPAHVEEIYKLMFSKRRDEVVIQINHLKIVSDGLAFIPQPTGPADIRYENVVKCLRRVKANDGRKLTEKARDEEARKVDGIKHAHSMDRKYWEKKCREIEKMLPSAVFKDPDILFFLEKMAVVYGFRNYGDSFVARERNIEILSNVLSLFGFKKEHNIKRIENKLHDVSHSIYGSFSDIFVTDDDNLRCRSEAIFNFLGIKTRLMDKDEFIEYSRVV